MEVVLNRALSLATSGLLAGSAIALATHGFIQVPQTVDIPVIELPADAMGGGTSVYGDVLLALPEKLRYVTNIRLLLRSETLAKLKPPLVIQKLEPTGLRAYFDAQATLHIMSATEWNHISQGAIEDDDEEVFLLMAAQLLWEKDGPIIWDEPYDS